MIALCQLCVRSGFTQSKPLPRAIEDFRVEHFTKDQGLPDFTVWGIQEDSTGFIWLGTNEGLIRFDGYSFKAFRPRPRDTTSIGALQSRALYLDDAGQIWAAGGQATSRYNVETDQFQRYHHIQGNPDSSLFGFPSSMVAIPDERGILWVGAYSTRGAASGLSRLNIKTGVTRKLYRKGRLGRECMGLVSGSNGYTLDWHGWRGAPSFQSDLAYL